MQTTTPENGKGRRAGNTTTPMQTAGDATARRQRQQAPTLIDSGASHVRADAGKSNAAHRVLKGAA